MDARARYDEIAADLEARDPDVKLGQMMGMPAIKAGGKMIGGFWQDAMVFKLPDPTALETALTLDGTALFDPSGAGRPMKQWVQVPAAHADRWPELADTALRLRAG
jgi:hypothetical protein